MSELSDIKDRSTNKNLIEALERLLGQAKTGHLRSLHYISAYDDQSVSTGFALDERSSLRLLYAEMTLAHQDFAANILIGDGFGRLYSALRDGVE